MSLPSFQTDILALSLMQSRWSTELDPLLTNPVLLGNNLKEIHLINGVTIINHRLGRKMQGWVVTDIDGAASIYRSAPFNALTFALTSNAAVTVNIYVF